MTRSWFSTAIRERNIRIQRNVTHAIGSLQLVGGCVFNYKHLIIVRVLLSLFSSLTRLYKHNCGVHFISAELSGEINVV